MLRKRSATRRNESATHTYTHCTMLFYGENRRRAQNSFVVAKEKK